MNKPIVIACILTLLLASCSAPKQVAYYQDVLSKDVTLTAQAPRPITIQSGDKLMIVVNSSNPQLAAMFNLPVTGTRIGMTNQTGYNYTQATMSYTVASDGTIDFPELGYVAVAGKTREEVARTIKNRLVDEDLCKDATVIVEIDNLYIDVLGEVLHPGRYAITRDIITLEDALAMAGDLGIQGKRENVTVIRTTPEGKQTYSVDMTNLQQVLDSPSYYLQQNDVVYVEPGDVKKRETTVSGNNFLSTSFWISLASVLTSMAVLFFK